MSGASDRIDGLCAWRALLMIAGLFLHATMGQEHLPAFAAINIASGSFRMGTFFMISGLLSSHSMSRRADAAAWTRRRLVQLSMPTLFGIAVICPVIGVLLWLQHGGAGSMLGLNVYHLWFMIALLLYTGVGYVADLADLKWAVFARLDRRAQWAHLVQPMTLLLLGAVCFVLMVATMQFTVRWVPEHLWPLFSQLRLVVGYAPMFLLGFAIARAPTLRDRLTSDSRLPFAILGIVLVGYLSWRSVFIPMASASGQAWGQDMLLIGAAAWCPPAAAVLILRSAIAMRRVPMLLQRLSDASFTMYIVHYPIIVAIKLAASRLLLGPWSSYAIAIVLSGWLSYWFHVALVTRSRTLTLLLNGRHECVPVRGTVPAPGAEVQPVGPVGKPAILG